MTDYGGFTGLTGKCHHAKLLQKLPAETEKIFKE